ncbi:hypothetical protein BGZ60DRAFT_529435 [Tricladium varicosporioides]|nr:hypothetical protein BGZ60DRAFT_529435 [Hymenoscyphus varicosporioides]
MTPYQLRRAFLQGVFFEPNIPTRTNPVTIGAVDPTIPPSKNDCAASSTNATGSSPAPNQSNSTTSTETVTEDKELRTGAKVGIAVGNVPVASIDCGALFFFIGRHRVKKVTSLEEEKAEVPHQSQKMNTHLESLMHHGETQRWKRIILDALQ